MNLARGFLPFMMGMCLAIAFSSLSISFYEQICTFQRQHSDQSYGAYQYDSSTRDGANDQLISSEEVGTDADEKWVYYVPPLENEDDFEPRRSIPNFTAPRSKTHVKRPVFLADELGLKKKLLVVVYSRQDSSDSTLLAMLNATLIEAAKREDTFFEKTVHFVLITAPSDVETASDGHSLLRHFVQVYSTQVVDTYEWFFVARASTYVTVNRLLDLVTLRLSEYARSRVIGFWQSSDITGPTLGCSDSFGLLVSAQILKELRGGLAQPHFDTKNFVRTRCADLRSEMQYTSSSDFLQSIGKQFADLDEAEAQAKRDGTFDRHGDAQPVIDADSEADSHGSNHSYNPGLKAIRSPLMHEHVLVVHGVSSAAEYAAVHRLCVRMDLLNVESQIDKLRHKLAQSWRQSPYPDESRSWALGVHHVPAPKTRFDVIPYHFFNDTHVFFRTELSVVEPLASTERTAIRDHIEQTIALSGIALERVVNWTLVNGYRRFDPVRGVEFITDLDIYHRDATKSPPLAFVRRRIHSIRPLSKPELVPTPFASESTRLTVVYLVRASSQYRLDVRNEVLQALFDPYMDAASFLRRVNASAFDDFVQVLVRGDNSYVRTAASHGGHGEHYVQSAVQAVEQAATLLCGTRRGVTAACGRVADTRMRFLFVLDHDDSLSPVRRSLNDVMRRIPSSSEFIASQDLNFGELVDTQQSDHDEAVEVLQRAAKGASVSPDQRAAAISSLVTASCARSNSAACLLLRVAKVHPWLSGDTMVLHATSNAVLSADFFNRARVHTMREFQVYAPVGFQFYHPEWSRDDLFDALDMHLHPRLRELYFASLKQSQQKAKGGRFDQLNGPFIIQQSRGFFDTDALFDADVDTRDAVFAFYQSDLRNAFEALVRQSALVTATDSVQVGRLSLFEVFAASQRLAAAESRKPVHIFRPVEPTLFLRYRVKPPCDSAASSSSSSAQRRCEQNRANSLTTNPKLARLVTFVTNLGERPNAAIAKHDEPPVAARVQQSLNIIRGSS